MILCLCGSLEGVSRAAESVTENSQSYLRALVDSSRALGLAEQRTWHALLHYRQDVFGSGVTSEVDDPMFFLAATGRFDSRAELEATLAIFFSSEKIGRQEQSPQCAFPARYRWLDSRLHFDPARMPVQACESIGLWHQRLKPQSVSLVFSSHYLNNPASMFGHTFLRLNRENQGQPELLDIAISFSAVGVQEAGPIGYAWNGLTGGFEGRFSAAYYYDMIDLYNDLEDRDLWEYRLSLAPEQLEMMLLHVWELLHTRFDFFFLRENCSYQLLALLEVADPDLRLRENYRAWTLPAETVKQIARQPGLVVDTLRRPSLSSQVEQRLAALSQRDQTLVLQFAVRPRLMDTPQFTSLDPIRRARIIDAAIDHARYLMRSDRDNGAERKRGVHDLLLERSRLEMAATESGSLASLREVSPDQGHDPVRLEIAGGRFEPGEDSSETKASFTEVSIQPGYHDLLSNEAGHAPNSQIRVFNLRTRYAGDDEEWRLQELMLVDIVSLYPLSTFAKQPSWKVKLGWEHNRDGACADCTPFVFNPGVGAAIESSRHRRQLWFALLEANFELDHELDSDYRGGFGATLGLLLDINDRWRLALTANRTRYTAGDDGYVGELGLHQRIDLSRSLELVVDIDLVEEDREGRIGLAYNF